MRPDPRIRGFSLIEVIAAMSVLAIIMVLISQAYTSVNGSWRDGMVSSDQNAGGRAALAFMARELSQAVVDSKYQMVVRTDKDTSPYGGADSAIWFTTLSGQPRKTASAERRQIQDISYYVATDGGSGDKLVNFQYRKLRRIGNYKLAKLPPYSSAADIEAAISRTGSDFNTGGDLLPFVHKFEITLYCTNLRLPGSAPVVRAGSGGPSDYLSHTNGGRGDFIPAYADLYLEVLGQDVAQLLAEGGLSAAEKTKYAENNLQRFTTRVYFPNMTAYNRIGP